MEAPPLLFQFTNNSIDDYLYCLSGSLTDIEIENLKKLIDKNLPPVINFDNLSVLLSFSPTFIKSLAKNNEKYYREFSIFRGKGRKKRKIQAPKVSLKVIQKWIGYHLSHNLKFDDCVHGFIPEHSYITAATIHCNAKWVYSIDIQDFFSTTSRNKVITALQTIGYSQEGSILLSDLCCFKENLAQGSPASPVLSNLVFKEIDIKINNLLSELSPPIKYTRYADDLVFSGTDVFNTELYKVKKIITNAGWKISKKKEKLAESPHRLKVHGLLVHGEKPRLTKGYRNKIRTYKHLLKNDKIKEEDIAKIKGHLAHAKYIENI